MFGVLVSVVIGVFVDGMLFVMGVMIGVCGVLCFVGCYFVLCWYGWLVKVGV